MAREAKQELRCSKARQMSSHSARRKFSLLRSNSSTKNETHPVTFCYRDGKLAQINEDGQEIALSGSAVAVADRASCRE